MNKRLKKGFSMLVFVVLFIFVVNSAGVPAFMSKNSFELSAGAVGVGIGSFFGPVGAIVGGTAGVMVGSVDEVEAWIHIVVTAVVGAVVGGIAASGGSCSGYSPPTKNYDCEICNDENYFDKCTEYRCKAIGSLCEFEEQNGRAICYKKECNDVGGPEIVNCEAIILDDGTRIETQHNDVGCILQEPIAEFSTIAFKIDTDQFSNCKISGTVGVDFDDDENNIWLGGETSYNKDHYFTFTLGDIDEEFLDYCESQDTCRFYIRCGNNCGYNMNYDYALSFDFIPAPDIQPPIIIDTVVEDGSYAQAGLTEIDFWMYVFDFTGVEGCRWSDDEFMEYEDMTNEFSCSNEFDTINGGYLCETVLTGLEDGEDSTFYFSCMDTTEDQNVLMPSYEFLLRGSTPLEIVSIDAPTGTYLGAGATISVTTNRAATCSYVYDGVEDEFEDTGNEVSTHLFEFNETEDVVIQVSCYDDYGNFDDETIEFHVDAGPPRLLRIYTRGNALYFYLSKSAECRFSNDDSDFDFEEGTATASSGDGREHQTVLDSDVYYVKCRDILEQEIGFAIYP